MIEETLNDTCFTIYQIIKQNNGANAHQISRAFAKEKGWAVNMSTIYVYLRELEELKLIRLETKKNPRTNHPITYYYELKEVKT